MRGKLGRKHHDGHHRKVRRRIGHSYRMTWVADIVLDEYRKG